MQNRKSVISGADMKLAMLIDLIGKSETACNALCGQLIYKTLLHWVNALHVYI